jgi:hemoglobin/transferrin/lactoferrin receptor protein
MGGWKGRYAPVCGISFVALTVGLSSARAQPTQTLDPITVLATKTIERTIEALAMVSSVRQGEIDQLQPRRTSDLFFGLPSVWFRERADSPETAINIRGLQDFGRVAVVVDGARQNFQRSGHNANGTFFLEPELVSEVDVARGPVTNVYGSGAIGGVVSFRTKDVDDVLKPGERYGGVANFNLGSNQARGVASFFGAGRAGPNVDVIAGGSYRSQSDYKDGHGNVVPNSGYDVATGLGKVTLRPADGHEVKLGATTEDFRYKTGQVLPNQESAYLTNVVNNNLTARYRYSKPEDYLFDFTGSAYWTTTAQDQLKVQNGTPGSSGNPITGSIGDNRSFKIDTKGFDLNNTSRFNFGDFRNAFTYGGDLFRDEVTNFDPTGNGAVTTPNGERTVSGGFVQWKGNYSRWLELIGALRFDHYDLSSPSNHAEGSHLSPKGTIGITPINGFTVYGTFAEGYRAPAVTETLVAGAHPPFAVGFPNLFTFLPNPNLRPEAGQTKEIGVNLKYDDIAFKGDKLRIKADVFRNDVQDYIELVQFGPPVVFSFCPAPVPGCPPVPRVTIPINSTSLAQYQNIGNARIEGVEFEGTYDAGDWFVGLSGQHIRGKDVTANIPLLTVQPDQLATTFGVRLLERKLTVSVRWQAVAAKNASDIPDRNKDGIPDFAPVGAYNLVNLYIGYQPTEDVLASFSIENLLNQYYVQYMNAEGASQPGQPPAVVFPSPGITFKGGLKLRFGVS